MKFFGAAFTAAVCWALGTILFRRLGIVLQSVEHELLAGLTGASLLSFAVFILCAVHAAYTPVFLAFGLLLFWTRGHLPRLIGHGTIAGAVFVFYGVIYLSNSLAPEMSPDGAAYHLGLVSRYLQHHGLERVTTNMYASLSQGMEMLFLFAFAFGRHSAAATLHCFLLFTLPLLMMCYGRRIGHPAAGVCAAMLFFLSPLAAVDGVSAYNDVALATTAFGMFYLLEIWRESQERRLLIPIGLLAGFCFAIKYTGFIAPIYMLVALWRGRKLPSVAAASLMILPWLMKNWIWLGNPFSPFLNGLFPNPFIHISFEDSYRHYFQSYRLTSLKPLFRMVTVTGELGGQIGAVFLLAPVALLSLRTRAGRRCSLAALFLLIPYPANIGARFLLPALPFIALAMALALEFSKPLLTTLVLVAAILAWPRVIDKYRAPSGGWQITTVPWQAALGIVPENIFLERHSPEYRIARMINGHVPADKLVFSTTALAEAYLKPEALVNYYSAEGESIEDILLTPLREDRQPLLNLRFTFPLRTVDNVRFLQTAISPDDIWSIGEARFFHGETEIHPARADATPFPWTAGLALDGNPVTRWRSWESIHQGMHFDAYFKTRVQIDRIELHCSHDQAKINIRIDGFDAKLEKVEDLPPGDLRRLAIRTIATYNVDYLLIGANSPVAEDIQSEPSRWNLSFRAEQGSARLYKIDEQLLPRR